MEGVRQREPARVFIPARVFAACTPPDAFEDHLLPETGNACNSRFILNAQKSPLGIHERKPRIQAGLNVQRSWFRETHDPDRARMRPNADQLRNSVMHRCRKSSAGKGRRSSTACTTFCWHKSTRITPASVPCTRPEVDGEKPSKPLQRLSILLNIIVVMLNIKNLGRKRRFSAVPPIQALRLPMSATRAVQTSGLTVAAPRTARPHCCSIDGFTFD